MAVCKRCGASFDYNNRDGVCPKCCFYNRPAGTWQDDDSWVKNYNYEDNSYNVTVHDDVYGSEQTKDSLKDILLKKNYDRKWGKTLDHKEVSGSHVHTSDGRVVKTSASGGKKKAGKKKGSCFGTIVKTGIIFALIYYGFFFVYALFEMM